MNGKLIDRLVAAGVFLYALVIYLLTMAETAPFWDSGEFIASVYRLQVMHPPGAPFYILLGRFFTFLAPLFGGVSPEPVAFSVNLISVLGSAVTVVLTHLVIVRLVRIWKGTPETWSGVDRLSANAGGVIGALAFAVTDSFWFNAVEAEVYALSMLFTALVVWLILRWREATLDEEAALRARGEHPFGLKADRYLLLIAYLFGLAIGVHLLNLLALFFVALVVFFTKVDREDWTPLRRWIGIAVAGVVAAVIFFAVYPGIIQWLPSVADAMGSPTLFFLLLVALVTTGVVVTQRRRMPIANLAMLSLAVILLGYSTYGIILVRSAADPPIDLNDPETGEAFVSYLKREQYGSTPLLFGANYDPQTGQVGRYRTNPVTGQVLVDEEGFPEVEEEFLPRRWSQEPSHLAVYRQYTSDWDFFWSYQLGHMYVRYFMWQFAGKASDVQDSPWISGIGPDVQTVAFRSPSERASRNVYFGLPLLLGLIGMAFHFIRDWRRAFAVLILFLVTGIGIILYLNQPPNQPRERDYSYVASFFAFSLWIGLGATGLLELATDALKEQAASMRKGVAGAMALVLFLAVPGLMLTQNFDDHDRSGRRLASDFARNMLESTAPNAIIFTNGDNDTYPLWYLQDVMGVRRDVRVVNLSLLNTAWYIQQLKEQWALDSPPIPMTLSDDEIANIRPAYNYQPTDITLPVNPERFVDETIRELADTTGIGSSMTWRLEGRPFGGERRLLYVSDLASLSIIQENARQGWPRPIYFASTVASDSELNLQPFFQDEGLARRVLPFRTDGGPDGRVVPEISLRRFANYQFRGLADPDVYYDQNSRNMGDTYRRVFAAAAVGMVEQGRTEEARALLQRVNEEVSPEVIPPSYLSLILTAQAYEAMGDTAGVVNTLKPMAEDYAINALESARTTAQQDEAAQYIRFIQIAYMRTQAYDAASEFYDRIAEATNDPSFRITPEELRREAETALAPAPVDEGS
ncbi:MAG: DUF2723 domain-containing protein [Rhodothermaceae bacterium]|nr:DUF2723 domain-containing protein [Rhodothermaceae bacterium]